MREWRYLAFLPSSSPAHLRSPDGGYSHSAGYLFHPLCSPVTNEQQRIYLERTLVAVYHVEFLTSLL